MVIHFLKEDCLAALKSNLEGNAKFYSSPTNEWIHEYFGDENPFAEYKVPVEDFQLTMPESGEDMGKADTENAIALYSAMKNLSDTQASDERLWAGLSHCDLWKYMYQRWKNTKFVNDPKYIESRYFFKISNGWKRSLFVNSLSKLWWLGRLTYDASRKNPFELIQYFKDGFSTKLMVLFSSNYMSNPEVSRGLISALIELEKENFSIPGPKRELYYQASQFLNVYGGTHILDYYTEEDIKERVLHHMYGLIEK